MDFSNVLFSVQDKLPKDGISAMTLKEKFESLSESKQQEVVSNLPMLGLKSPALVFWVGTFLFGVFGVGRFMIGDIALGSVRLGLFLAWIIFAILGVVISPIFSILCIFISYLAIPIWQIVDMFLVGKKLRKKNFEKILNLMQ
ncbi:hypothetical protein [Campylobacter molothri]|uniref:hypothetical protein n=1 Tax=Campylobacter molothri TaxID=1032242 RepID=UPI001DC8CF8B|nr:hypothetical protein [Campylobacter sp. RM12397]